MKTIGDKNSIQVLPIGSSACSPTMVLENVLYPTNMQHCKIISILCKVLAFRINIKNCVLSKNSLVIGRLTNWDAQQPLTEKRGCLKSKFWVNLFLFYFFL